MTIAILTGILCMFGLSYINLKEKWDNATIPPKGWMQYKGFRRKMY